MTWKTANAEHPLRLLNPNICNEAEYRAKDLFRLTMVLEDDGKYAAIVTFKVEHQMIRGPLAATPVEALSLLHRDIASALSERFHGGLETVDRIGCHGSTHLRWEPASFPQDADRMFERT